MKNEFQTLEVLPHIENLEKPHTFGTTYSEPNLSYNKRSSRTILNETSQYESQALDCPLDQTQESLDHEQTELKRHHSLHSQSSSSDSKPDVVKCTGNKVKRGDHSAPHRHSFSNDRDLRRQVDLPTDEQALRKKSHSTEEIDELNDLAAGITHNYSTETDIRKYSTESGIWLNPTDSSTTVNDGIWMTGVQPRVHPDGWRLSLDHFSPKMQGSNRKAKHVSKRARSFYKYQDELIKSFESIRYEMEEDKIDMKKIRKKVGFYAKLTFFTNLVLLVIKVVAVVLSGSVSLISSLVDSSVDLVSGVVIWITNRLVKKTDPYLYPQGRTKLEPIAVVILSVIMAVASLHLIEETVERIVQLASGQSEPPRMEWITVGISSATVVVKLVLFLICRKVPHHSIQALAQDHRNDVLSNSAAVIFGYIGSKQMQAGINNSVPELVFLDPVGAILICAYIAISWCHTGWGQIKMLTGHTAKPDFLSKITWLSLDHHEKIQKINSVRAFHFGNNFLVEIEILLPADMSVTEACDISKPLEEKLERLAEVERAFVHIDYMSGKQKRNKIT